MSSLQRKVLMIKPDYAFYSIGMAYVAAGLRKQGIEYDWFDAHLEPHSELERLLDTHDYLAVATGGLIGSFTFFRRLFSAIKTRRPSMPCILGGNITHALKPDQLFKFYPVDYLVLGEGEESLAELLQALDKGDVPNGVAGLAFRNPDQPEEILRTAPRPRLDLSKENWIPHWDAKTMERYGANAFPILTGRGCTGRCTFCAPTNGRFRGRPLEHILEEIQYLNANFQFNAFNFLNEILFDNPDDIERFCDAYEQLKTGKHWSCLLRVDLDPSIIKRMRRAGLLAVNVGVESGSDRVLKRIRKDTTVAQIRSFVQALKDNDVIIDASFMMGLLDERIEDMDATIQLMRELKVVGPMALTINYPGTFNYRVAKERGLVGDEEKYIESLDKLYSVDPYDLVTRYRAGELNYANLSGVPDDAFFTHVETCIRDYSTNHFAVRNPQVTQGQDPHHLQLSGDCPFCGNHRSSSFNVRAFPVCLLRMLDCERCGVREIYFNPHEIPVFREHFQNIAGRIEGAKTIALLGQPAEMRWVLKHHHFGLEPSKIKGIIQHDEYWDGYAANHLVRPWKDLLAEGIDLVVVLGSLPLDLITQDFLEQMVWPKAVFLTPSAFAATMEDCPDPNTAKERASSLILSGEVNALGIQDFRHKLSGLIQDWRQRSARVQIHGVGPVTDLLFELTDIREANLVGLSDRNPYLKGKSRHGFTVRSPQEIPEAKPDVVLLASVSRQTEMRKDLHFLAKQGVELVGW